MSAARGADDDGCQEQKEQLSPSVGPATRAKSRACKAKQIEVAYKNAPFRNHFSQRLCGMTFISREQCN